MVLVLALALALTRGLGAFAKEARANGRFPQATQLVVDRQDPLHIVARTTYGLVQTTDGGMKWSWVCEKAEGYVGTFDAAIALTGTSTLLLGLPDGISRTTDRGCTFAYSRGGGGPLDGNYVIDLAVDVTNAKRVVAVTSLRDATQPGSQATFAETVDDGLTWRIPTSGDAGAPTLLPEDFKPVTVDLAPSRPQRVYASGGGAFPLFGVVVRSDDDGATWGSSSFDLRGARAAYIAAVDPKNPDRVYLRVDGDPSDRLAVSTDQGVTWKDVFTPSGKLLGFALSPDGSRVAVGGPTDGVFVASTSDFAFTKVSSAAARCLTWTTAGLYVCGYEFSDGYTVGVSADEGKTTRPLYHLRELTQLVCPAGTTTAVTCPAYWDATLQAIGQGPPDGGSGDASAPLDAAATDASTDRPSASKPACGCRVVGASASAAPIALATLALLAGLRRLRGRASSSRRELELERERRAKKMRVPLHVARRLRTPAARARLSKRWV